MLSQKNCFIQNKKSQKNEFIFFGACDFEIVYGIFAKLIIVCFRILMINIWYLILKNICL